MNGSTGNKAFDASEKPERSEVFLSLNTAQRMLPLVQRIVEDILIYQRTLDHLQPEHDRLERKRRTLGWPERQRRYALGEEVAAAEGGLQNAFEEMQALGVSLLDPETGRAGFPTLVNDRRAFFTWQPGEETLRSWHFAGETLCRPIPSAWMNEIALSGKR
jgi:hypothetical protein